MRDLTEGSVAKHLLHLAAFTALSAVFQTLYFLADLYFVGRLGKEAIAGVGLAGNLNFIVLALTQSLGVGATALVSQSMGRKDPRQAELVFNQALVLAKLGGLLIGLGFFVSRVSYCRFLAADERTAALGVQYLNWFVPALVLQFVLVTMTAVLRGIGDVKLPTLLQIGTVVLNVVLNPTLMFGWVTGRPMGVAGSALASFISVALGCVAFALYFRRKASPLRFRSEDWSPRPRLWAELLKIGLPAGGEFALMSVYLILIYSIMRPFGAAAQAGFGIGVRIIQALFLPSFAIAFATAPVAGQNFGAGRGDRVRETFLSAALMSAGLMLACAVLCRTRAEALIGFFSRDPAVIAAGSEYMRIISWNFVASGIVFVSSSVFQGMGNTIPALASSSLRVVLFALPVYLISLEPWFRTQQIWYLSVASVTIQVLVNLFLLRREFALRLPRVPSPESREAILGT